MIIRIIVVDPSPRDPRDDVIVYQVPDKSRAYELLLDMIQSHGLEHVEIKSDYKPPKKKGAPSGD